MKNRAYLIPLTLIFFLLILNGNFINAQTDNTHLTNVYFCTNNGWEVHDSVQYGSVYYCPNPEGILITDFQNLT